MKDPDTNLIEKKMFREPSGLAKIRYESEAYKWCAGSINQLRLMGIVKIKDGLPLSKFIMYLRTVKTPPALRDLTIDYVIMLQT